MVCLLISLSTGGSNKSKQMSGFYNGERLRVEIETSSKPPAAQTDQAAKDDSSKMKPWRRHDHGSSRWRGSDAACWYFHCPIGNGSKSISHAPMWSWCESWVMSLHSVGVEDSMRQIQIAIDGPASVESPQLQRSLPRICGYGSDTGVVSCGKYYTSFAK